jgi:predicted transcriptional regulator of viral defense system
MAQVILSRADAALELAGRLGIARARDFVAAGIPLSIIRRLESDGRLLQLGRGLYQLPELAGADAGHDLAEAAKRVPGGVICLLSALRHHGLTTQLPRSVWIMIGHKARAPKVEHMALTVVRASGAAFAAGVEHAEIEGVAVPIYSAAKTVADCFKYRSRIGVDVAIEALKDGLRERRFTIDALMEHARIDRVATVMVPYIEALT